MKRAKKAQNLAMCGFFAMWITMRGWLLLLGISIGIASGGCGDEKSTSHAREVLLSSSPHSPDASRLNDLAGEDVALSSPILIVGYVVNSANDVTPQRLEIKVRRVPFQLSRRFKILIGDRIVVRGPLGIELPANVNVVASIRRQQNSTIFSPTWVTAFVGLEGHGTVSFINAERQLKDYSTADPSNLFGCSMVRPAEACRRERLRAFGITTARQLRVYDRLVDQDTVAALLWMVVWRQNQDHFPDRLCNGASDFSNCGSYGAFARRLRLAPIQ